MSAVPPVTVLLVDDVPDVRAVVRGVLERHGGFRVVGEAGDGAEAVTMAAASRPDLILLDLDMPNVGGIESLPAIVAVAGLLETIEVALDESRVVLDRVPGAPRLARRFVDETLRRWDCADVLDVVELLVSELVTNAISHARSPAEVSVVLHRDRIRIEVEDLSSATPRVKQLESESLNGRGLAIVERLSSAWGVDELQSGGKIVWFEVPRLDSRARDAAE
jgi:CheY-like chemotaxis protein